MKRIASIFVVAGAAAIGIAGAFAAEDPLKARKDLMKTVGKNTKLTGGMVKGEVPFDAAQAKGAMETIAGVPDKFVTLFPKGSGKGDTRATPKIWEDKAGFEEWAQKLKTAASVGADAAAQGEDAFKTAFGEMVKACKGCHQSYRLEKK